MRTETDRVAEQLRNKVITLELEPGAMVTQAYLCDLLKCGRTPLREAIQRLLGTRLINHAPNRGIAIAPLDIRQCVSAAEAYAAVHGAAVRLAALRRTEEELAELERILAQGQPLLDESLWSELTACDVQFHCLLAEASHNEYLATAAADLELVIVRYSSLYYTQHRFRRDLWEQHGNILSAVRDQDPDKAEQLITRHSQEASRNLFEALLSMTAAGERQ